MQAWTYGKALDRVLSDLDLQNETFIQDDEMVGYFNEALDDANGEIMRLREDYYLKSCSGVLTANQTQLKFSGTDYLGAAFALQTMPPDIFANKLRSLIYQNGAELYEVKKVRSLRPFLELAMSNYNPTNQAYRYLMTNPTSAGSRIDLTPFARESGGFITAWYLRHLVKVPLVSDVGMTAARATVLDLPEFNNFILWAVKVMCLPKEGDPRTGGAVAERDRWRAQMLSTLQEKVEDDDNRMLMDLSDYEGHN